MQIAFNVDRPGAEGLDPQSAGHHARLHRLPGYRLRILPEQGGGQVRRRHGDLALNVPGMPQKNFYPRQAKSPFDGPVKDGQAGRVLRPRRGSWRRHSLDGDSRRSKERCDAGQPIKFCFRVNDNEGNRCMELARGRSVSKKINFFTFRPTGRNTGPMRSNSVSRSRLCMCTAAITSVGSNASSVFSNVANSIH